MARLRLFLPVLACFVVALCKAGLPNPAPREAGIGVPALQVAARPVLGANVDLTLLSPQQQTEWLDRLVKAGVGSLRLPLDWNRVEPARGKFAWKKFDSVVDAARARGLDVVLVLGPCADWAVDPSWEVPPADRRYSVPKLEHWRSYVKAAISHFRGRVSYWQIREQPNVRNFRGTPSEYSALVTEADKLARALDPASRIIVPEAGHLDLSAIDRFLRSSRSGACDVLGVYTSADSSRLLLSWAVLTNEVVAACQASQRRPIWVLGGEASLPEQWQIVYLIAWAFGAERCYLPVEMIDAVWTSPLKDLEYQGFSIPPPGAWAFSFHGPDGPVTAAWADRERSFSLTPILAPMATPTGAAITQEPAPASASPTTVVIGPSPVLINGQGFGAVQPGTPTRAEVLAARNGLSLEGVPLVFFDLSLPEHTEFGLSNRTLRKLRGGEVVEEQQQGRNCVRTRMTYREGQEEQDNPWLYFDVDDSWLYFDKGRTRIVVTVECEGSWLGEKKLGFNLLYDSTTGYRFTPWQWVDPGYGWHCYRVILDDVNFANRDGWDFRINAKGSKHDLWVCSVTVEKLPEEQAAESATP